MWRGALALLLVKSRVVGFRDHRSTVKPVATAAVLRTVRLRVNVFLRGERPPLMRAQSHNSCNNCPWTPPVTPRQRMLLQYRKRPRWRKSYVRRKLTGVLLSRSSFPDSVHECVDSPFRN